MHESVSSQRQYMLRALDLARMHNPAPNPAVGAVIVKKGRIIAEAAHKRAGEDHAEAAAIKLAGSNAAGATLYVTLEPCCHSGEGKRRPPCTKAVIESGISRVVAASEDPNPKVRGKGFEELRGAGIEVSSGLLGDEEKKLNRCYRRFQETGLPWVHLKQAVSLDGFIASGGKTRTLISCPEALDRVHGLRASHQAILVGGNTAIIDRPLLTVRRASAAGVKNPLRLVVEGRVPIPADNPVFDVSAAPSCLFTCSKNSGRLGEISSKGVEVIVTDVRPNLSDVLIRCGELGIISILIEAGGRLSAALLEQDLADEISLFYSPRYIGEGTAMAASMRFCLDESEWEASAPELVGRDFLLNWIRTRRAE